jgi:hypothetical protein
VAYNQYEQFLVYGYILDENIVIGLWGYTRTDDHEEIRLAFINIQRVEIIASRMTACSEENYLA